MAIDPTGDDVRTFRDQDDGAAVVMLNLLRFRPDGGRERYHRYSDEVGSRFLPKVGGEVLYIGRPSGPALVADESGRWDEVLLVRYPSRAAFLEMVGDPAYQEVARLRSAALEAAVLQPLTTVAASPTVGD